MRFLATPSASKTRPSAAGRFVNNTTGNANVAIGSLAAYSNFTGGGNTAVGEQALFDNQSGNYNIALGFAAGNRTTGSNNIVIGDIGVEGESNTIRIGGDGFAGALRPQHLSPVLAEPQSWATPLSWMDTVN